MFLMNVLQRERFSCFFLSIFFVTCAFCKEKQWSVIKTLGRARVRVARALGLQDLKRWIIDRACARPRRPVDSPSA